MTTDRERELVTALSSLYEVTARTTEAVAPELERHGLTFNTAFLLWMVDPDQPPSSMKTVAERMHCQPSNLTFLCDQLEAAGLLERVPSPTDRRQRVIRLTPRGREARDAVVAGLLDASPLLALRGRQLSDLTEILRSL